MSETSTKPKALDLRESLERLFGSNAVDPGDGDEDARLMRHLDLILWLINLERRLPPYGDTAA